jgi:xanthine dehydrogenase accessory factor
VLPAPRVAIVGDTPIARALASVGAALGYDIVEWSLPGMRTTDAVVVATHGFDEEQTLMDAVMAGIPYVALVSSPKRGAAVVESLALDDDQRARIKYPAGLDIGARTPEEVALSIFAEVIQRRSSSDASPARPSLPMLADEQAATAIDPICKMTVAAVEASIHADIDGTRWYFCCPGCKETFLADPSAYAGT